MVTEMEMWKNDYYEKEGQQYKNHVDKFIGYLITIDKADKPNDVDLGDVKNCVGYYRENINSRSSLELHIESLKSFYGFIQQQGKSKNIFSQEDDSKFKDLLVKEYDLVEKESRGFFSNDQVLHILRSLDDYLDTNSKSGKNNSAGNKKYKHYLILDIFIKLTLIAPAKRKTICLLQISDFFEDYHFVKINSIKVNIPNSLRRDIKMAVANCGEINKDDQLFSLIKGEKFIEEDLNRWFCTLLKEFSIISLPAEKETYSVEKIMETAIHSMVSRLTNPIYISKISGSTIATIEEKYYSKMEFITYNAKFEEIYNWEIAKAEYYSFI